MAANIRVSGRGGRVLVGSLEAYCLGAWEWTDWRIQGTPIAPVDPYDSSQEYVRLELDLFGKQTLVWRKARQIAPGSFAVSEIPESTERDA